MTKRRTRTSNKENDEDACRTNPHKKKRSSGKSANASKLPINGQNVVNTLGIVGFPLVSCVQFTFS